MQQKPDIEHTYLLGQRPLPALKTLSVCLSVCLSATFFFLSFFLSLSLSLARSRSLLSFFLSSFLSSLALSLSISVCLSITRARALFRPLHPGVHIGEWYIWGGSGRIDKVFVAYPSHTCGHAQDRHRRVARRRRLRNRRRLGAVGDGGATPRRVCRERVGVAGDDPVEASHAPTGDRQRSNQGDANGDRDGDHRVSVADTGPLTLTARTVLTGADTRSGG